jgi:hypothetical protein
MFPQLAALWLMIPQGAAIGKQWRHFSASVLLLP